jgi:hypothetical protein
MINTTRRTILVTSCFICSSTTCSIGLASRFLQLPDFLARLAAFELARLTELRAVLAPFCSLFPLL